MLRPAIAVACLTVAACSDDGEQGRDGAAATMAGPVTSTTASASTAAPTCTAPEPEVMRPEQDSIVTVFLWCDDGSGVLDLRPARRLVPRDGQPLRSSLTQLLLGVSPADSAAGLSSMFSSYTAGTLRGVTVESGVATLDFTAGFAATNNFSTSAGGDAVVRQIEATVFEFPEVSGIEFAIEGERWCLWENTCNGAPVPLLSR